ncbi:hypothetical protein FEM08_03710 [Flavobacterium gilvum]|nr:hypothetical protein FEM08_03710 [Flavobacterium gilvum]
MNKKTHFFTAKKDFAVKKEENKNSENDFWLIPKVVFFNIIPFSNVNK